MFKIVVYCCLLTVFGGCAQKPVKPIKQTRSSQNLTGLSIQTQWPPKIPSDIALCKTLVSNAPANNGKKLLRGSAYGCLHGVTLLIAPAHRACLSSAFGPRGRRMHKGLDYQSYPASHIYAAGYGTVVEKSYRSKDLGNWLVINHGDGVYSAYGHLAYIDPAIKVGSKLKLGQIIGKMGSTGAATRAVHLHYEVRIGDYANRDGWWGLTPVNLFNTPQRCASGQ